MASWTASKRPCVSASKKTWRFSVAAFCATGVVVLTTGTGAFSRMAGQPGHLFLAGLLVAFYVLSIT